MSIFSKIWNRLFPPTRWTHPDLVECPERYRAEVRDAFWYAAAHLEGQNIYGHTHSVRKITIVKGTHIRPGGWAVEAKFSPTGFAGGWASKTAIWLVCTPTGYVPTTTMRHEWGEAILMAAGINTMEERHAILGRAGL